MKNQTAELSLESRVRAKRCLCPAPCLSPALVSWTQPGRGLLMLIVTPSVRSRSSADLPSLASQHPWLICSTSLHQIDPGKFPKLCPPSLRPPHCSAQSSLSIPQPGPRYCRNGSSSFQRGLTALPCPPAPPVPSVLDLEMLGEPLCVCLSSPLDCRCCLVLHRAWGLARSECLSDEGVNAPISQTRGVRPRRAGTGPLICCGVQT